MARMRSLLRRQSAVRKAVLEHRGIKLESGRRRTVHLAGEPVDLPAASSQLFWRSQSKRRANPLAKV